MRIVEVPAGTVVVELEDDEASWSTLSWAAERAAQGGRDLTLVHALAVEERFGTDPWVLREVVGALVDAGQELLAAARHEARRVAPTLRIREVLRLVDRETAIDALVATAAEVFRAGTKVPSVAVVSH